MNHAWTRRQFLHTLGSVSAAMALGPAAVSQESRRERLNVLFIPVDDLNDWIGCLGGHPDSRTPNLDRLAERGVLFTRAYCASPLCNPSRTALLTGVLPSTSGVYDNGQRWRAALPDAVTLPQHFMANGYHVMGGGKIFHGKFNDMASWHEYYQRPDDPVPPNRPLNGIKNAAHFDWGPLDADDEDMGDFKLVNWAAERLQQKHDKPFFLAAGLIRPHLPWYVPRKYFEMYPPSQVALPKVKEDDLDDVPPIGRRLARPDGDHKNVLETNNWNAAVSSYLATIRFVDTCIGRLVDALDRSPYAQNTVVVLWGDHGWHLGEKLHWRKSTLWEEATRNPLMIAVPGMTRPGGRCERTVGLIDLYPTLTDVCGLPLRDGLAGQSLAPLLRNPTAPWDRPALTTFRKGNHSVRSERWRYIRYHDGTEELYDHSGDEMEWTNLAGKPELADVKKDLARWLPKSDADEVPSEPPS